MTKEQFKTPIAAESDERVLLSRAEQMARKTEETQTENRITVLAFIISGETYCIESGYLQEVIAIREMTELPLTPPFLRGIIYHRGKIISLIDISGFLNLRPLHCLPGQTNAVILSHEDMNFAILADEICGIIEIPVIQPADPSLQPGCSFIRGVDPQRRILIDGQKLLMDKRFIIHEEP